MKLSKVELSDRERLGEYFKYKQDKGCDMCFANIYLWCRKYPVGYAFVENCLVFGASDETGWFCFPYGKPEDIKRAIPVLRHDAESRGVEFGLYLTTPSDFEKLEEWFPGEYTIEYDRDLADYVYETEKLINLSGKKYHGKKNHLNRFKADFPDWTYEPITDDNVEECFTMAMKWRGDNGCEENEEKRAEMCVSLNALRLMKELKLKGGLIRAGKEVVAFSIGEELNNDTFVVHIEKAFADVPGAYTIINQQFAEHEAVGYKYLNREDDAGSEGLRKAKESYKPAFLLEKGEVRVKKA